MLVALVRIFGLPCEGPKLCCRERTKVKISRGPSSSPCAAGSARVDALDDAHVGDSIGERSRYWLVVEDGANEGVGLQRVLIADVEADLFGRVRVGLQPEPTRAVAGHIERNLDFNATGGAEDVYPLIGGDLGADGKSCCAGGELKYRG